MNSLIEELKGDHARMLAHLDEVRKLGIGSKDGRAKLMNVKGTLLGHLKKEDVRLYPSLHEAAKTNAELKSLLDRFAKDMEEVSRSALAFFDKYAQGGDPIEFGRDYGKLSVTLNNRMRREETTLYPEFEKLGMKKSA